MELLQRARGIKVSLLPFSTQTPLGTGPDLEKMTV